MRKTRLVKAKMKLRNWLIWLSVIAAVAVGGYSLYCLLDGMLKEMLLFIIAIIWLLMANARN